MLLALICNLEAAFSAFKAKKLTDLTARKDFSNLRKTLCLIQFMIVIEFMIVMGKHKKIVNDDNHPIKEIFKILIMA